MQGRSGIWAVALSFFAVVMAGCGVGPLNTSSTGRAVVPGTVMGGQQPVSGATIQIYTAANGGYGSASSALLSTPAVTDSGGGFTITTPYTCPSGSQAYIVASGGNPGLGGTVNNQALTLMAALGPCENLTASTHIVINEVTTVAAVWALSRFMTAYNAVGSPASNKTGLANAFAMAADLASADRGQSPGDAPSGSTIPTDEINALANILASCVNTDGSTAAGMPCGKLFSATTAGSTPTETVGAALNIALHPAQNVSTIFGLSSSFAAFPTSMTTAPNDWTMAMKFPVAGATTNGLALDAQGHAYVINPAGLHVLSANGALIGDYAAMGGYSVTLDADGNIWTGGTGPLGGHGQVMRMPAGLGTLASYDDGLVTAGSANVVGIAADGNGNVWYACANCQYMGKMSAAGTFLGAYGMSSDNHGTAVAVDGGENVWKTTTSDYVSVVANGGTSVGSSPYTCIGCATPFSIAMDANGVGWIAGGTLQRLTSAGSFTTYSYFTGTGGGLYNLTGVAIDGANSVWGVNAQNISNQYPAALSGYTNGMTAITPSLGYVSNTMSTPKYVAIDGAGNVWTGNTGNGSLTVFVGVATPTVTPLALAVKNGTIGTKP